VLAVGEMRVTELLDVHMLFRLKRLSRIHRPVMYVGHAVKMEKPSVKADRKLNMMILLLSGFAFLIAVGLMFSEGFWSAIATFGILLVVILVAAIPVKHR